ncbi:MAG: hypothetical protein AAGI23_22230 [Bacteroidota bacterium]
MQTVTVELMSDKALALLQQLEQLHILRFVQLQKRVKTDLPKRKWGGSISKSTAKQMIQYTEQSRGEWERTIF